MFTRKSYSWLKFPTFWVLAFTLMSISQSVAQDIVPVGRIDNVQKFVRSPVGDVLAIADTGGRIFLWEPSLQEIIRYLDGESIGARLESLRWSPDGHFLVGGFSDVGRLWNADSGELLREFDIHPIHIVDEAARDYGNGVTDIAISPDGSIIATAQQYDSSVALWNAQTYELLQTLDNHEVNNSPVGIDQVEFSSDGIALAANSYLNTTLWNVQTGQRLQVGGGDIIAFSPDGTKLATGFGRLTSYIETWDVATGERLNTFEAPLVISGLQWAADSKTLIGNFTEFPLVSGYYEWTGEMVRSWDAVTNEPIQIFSFPTHQLIAVELAPNETLLGFGVAHGEGYVLVWNEEIDDTYTKPIVPEGQENDFEMTQESIYDFRLSPDETMLATAYRDRVVIWNFATGAPIYTIQETPDGICNLDWLFNTPTLVTLCEGRMLSFWDVSSLTV